MNLSHWWRIGIAVGVLAALVAVVEWRIGWRALLAGWHDVPLPDLVLATALMVGSHLARGWRLRGYLRARAPVGAWTAVRISVLHAAAVNLLPVRAGEAALPLLLRRRGIALSDGIAGLIWLRVFDLHALLTTAAVFVAVGRWGAGGATLTGLAVLAALPLAVHLLARAARPLSLVTRPRLAALGGALTHRPPAPVALYGWTLLGWSMKWAAMTSILLSLIPVDHLRTAVAVVAGELAAVLPIHGVAGAGTYEAAMVAGLSVDGAIPVDRALAAAVNLHIFVLGVSIALAVAVLPFGRRRLRHAA